MKRLFLILSFAAITVLASAQDKMDCFGIIVGKNASADGSVILAHNEDDGGEQMLNFYMVTAQDTDGESKQYGKKAAGYFWAELPGMSNADGFMNKNGVAVVSDSCNSKEDQPELTEGGIYYQIRVNAARYAHSAREAVTIIGSLVDRYGYGHSGRTYLVADVSEAWMVSLVYGKHWVAQRIPDDGVVIIPNYYVIDKVDLSDTANFAGSPDLVSYAISRGWYDPAKDGEFSFRKAYSSEKRWNGVSNIERHKDCLKAFGVETEDPRTTPFSITPKEKVTVGKLMEALSLHKPKYERGSICDGSTVLSTIFHMRPYMPKGIGCVCWMAIGHPCIEPYFPVYMGMSSLPRGFARYISPFTAESRHFTHDKDLRKNNPDVIWWKHLDRWNYVYADFARREYPEFVKASVIQEEMFEAQAEFENRILEDYAEDISSGSQLGDNWFVSNRLNKNFAKWYSKWAVNL